MKKKDFLRIKSEEEFVALLKAQNLYREDDVTFDDLGSGKMYVYRGDSFAIDEDLLADLEPSALLVEGNVRVTYLSVADVLADVGVFCVSGDVSCTDMLYMTESTGVVIAGSLQVENIFYADCGNSVLQVNKDVRAKLFYESQCEIEVGGKRVVEFDENITVKQLKKLGLKAADKDAIDETVRAYFEKYSDGDKDEEDEEDEEDEDEDEDEEDE